MSAVQLQLLRDKYNIELCDSRSVKAMVSAFNFGINAIEKLALYAGYDCTRAAVQVISNKDFQKKDLRQLAIMYMQPGVARPELSAALQVGQAFIGRYVANAQKTALAITPPLPPATPAEKPVSQGTPKRIF